jgi:hypothetical protein
MLSLCVYSSIMGEDFDLRFFPGFGLFPEENAEIHGKEGKEKKGRIHHGLTLASPPLRETSPLVKEGEGRVAVIGLLARRVHGISRCWSGC